MKRPLLTPEDRRRLRIMADHADRHADSPSRAYARGVADVLRWLDNGQPTPMLRDITR